MYNFAVLYSEDPERRTLWEKLRKSYAFIVPTFDDVCVEEDRVAFINDAY
jgi:hypothetical protein